MPVFIVSKVSNCVVNKHFIYTPIRIGFIVAYRLQKQINRKMSKAPNFSVYKAMYILFFASNQKLTTSKTPHLYIERGASHL